MKMNHNTEIKLNSLKETNLYQNLQPTKARSEERESEWYLNAIFSELSRSKLKNE